MVERTVPSIEPGFPEQCGSQTAELDIGFLGRTQAITSYSQETGVTIAKNGLYYDRTTSVTRPSDPEASGYQAPSPQVIKNATIDPFMSLRSSTEATSDIRITSPPPAVYNTPAASNSTYNQLLETISICTDVPDTFVITRRSGAVD